MCASPNLRGIVRWPRGLQWTVAILMLAAVAAPATALGAAREKVVTYLGEQLRVPASWPVYRLDRDPTQCVRFNRHAVYLGQPGANQHCPQHSVGRTEAILAQPIAAHTAVGTSTSAGLTSTSSAAADAAQGSLARVVDHAHGLIITATWRDDPAVIKTALGGRSPSALAAASHTKPAAAPAASSPLRPAALSAAAATAGQVYIGPGFDACAAPSMGAMAAWNSSPYHGIGVYIGGANMGCAQYNLTASWVRTESGAGWHLLPIYVGLQAPSNVCGCAGISPAYAATQGIAAARDAVAQAQARAMGTGNPIYFDMESYARTSTNTSAVMTFLSAWTYELHTLGYVSGIYSSEGSGIVDLSARWGSGYREPDDIWIADYDNYVGVNNGYVPTNQWANHQRVHQYNGGVNRSYGGVTINIDGDWLNAATAAAGAAASVSSAPPRPSAKTKPSITGTPKVGQTLSETHATWANSPTSYAYQWQRCNASGSQCAAISGATQRTYTLGNADAGFTIRVAETASNGSGRGNPAVSAATSPVAAAPAYWMFTAYGNVYSTSGAGWYGSPANSHVATTSITGMAVTLDRRGYWLVSSSGQVYAYGDATRAPAQSHTNPITGIVAAPAGGYWLFTAHGNIYSYGAAGWYGSPAASNVGTSSIVGMTSTRDGRGYWLITSSGQVYAYGDAAKPAVPSTYLPIKGIVAAPTGYWIYNVPGNVQYTQSAGTIWYGSPASSGSVPKPIVGMAATRDGKGYWLADSAGHVWAYGDAQTASVGSIAHQIIGIAG